MHVETLPKSGLIRLKTPSGKLRVDVPELPGEGVENCEAEITCANGEVQSCGTPINATAWACSAGSGAATCMYLSPDMGDKWIVTNVGCK